MKHIIVADSMFLQFSSLETSVMHSWLKLIPISLECHILVDCVWLKPGVGHSFTVICLEVLPHTAAAWHQRHIERIRGINAYSLACSISPWQVCGGALVNSHVGASVRSKPAWGDRLGFVVSDQSRLGVLLHATQRVSLIFTDPYLYPEYREL